MIYVVLGSACYQGGGVQELARYVETCDQYLQVVNEVAECGHASEYCVAIARVVEAIWVTRACEIVDQAVPTGDEPESVEFAVCVASIFSPIQEQIAAVEASFS